MNSEDKKRFERYMKGYVPKDEDNFEENDDKNKIGFINNINIEKKTLITNIIDKNNKDKNNKL
jgi:hypothetical protein